jgi:hypothetical protein
LEKEIEKYNNNQLDSDKDICDTLAIIIDEQLEEAECKLWHGHPVWFLDGNPIVGYDKLKAGVRLMFWSGADFDEDKLKIGTGKFRDACIFYNRVDEIDQSELTKWLIKSREIQWDYKNIVKRKGKLIRLK